ncbi:MAG: hypothetical protein V1678_04130, partial [Candidatus Aenigmatarchaeota archaeon]
MVAIPVRGLQIIIFGLMIIAISVALFIITDEAFKTQSLELFKKFDIYAPYYFDINDLITNDPKALNSTGQNAYYGIGTANSDPDFCKALRDCIETNLKGGTLCLISYKVSPGTPFNPNDISETISNRCPAVDIKDELYGNTQRKVCKFKTDSIEAYNKIREDDIRLLKYEPYLHGCYIPENLGSYNVLGDTDSINYLYSGRGTPNGYDFKNGGMVRMIVTNVSIDKTPTADCSYSIYVCGQNAIANSTKETPVNIFTTIQGMKNTELYYNETLVWKGPKPKDEQNIFGIFLCWIFAGPILAPYVCPALPSFPAGYNAYGYNPHTYEFTFNGTYNNKESIIDAVDAGMWEWSKANYMDSRKTKYFSDVSSDISRIYFSYSPITSINSDPSISFGSGCWDPSFETSDVYDRTMLFTSGASLPDNTFTEYKIFKNIFNFSTVPFDPAIGDK